MEQADLYDMEEEKRKRYLRTDKEEIPVLFTPDENFMLQTCVAILSMQTNKKKNTNYHYYLLVSDDIDVDSFKYLRYLEKIDSSILYTITYFNTTEIDSQKINTPYVTSSTFYRLYVADLFDFDRCIYHDGDIIVNDDLAEMYNIEMKDNYVAGVKSIIQQQGELRDIEMLEKWGFQSMNQYILAGNLIFNLKKIREDNLVKRFDDEIRKGYPQQDQDVLNYCCYNHISFLKPKFCLLNRWVYTKDLYNFKNQIFDIEDIDEALCRPSIVHFAGGIVKPWINIRVAYASIWWKYARELLPESEYDELYKGAEYITKQRDWSSLIQFVEERNGRSIYIFGYTWIGIMLVSWLRNNDINVVGFIDSNIELQGVQEGENIVFGVQEVSDNKDAMYIIASQKAYEEIANLLLDRNVKYENIFVYKHKDELYLQSLDPKYRRQEYQDLMAKKIGRLAYGMTEQELRARDTDNDWEKIWR